MTGLINLDVYYSIFNTTENNNFQLYFEHIQNLEEIKFGNSKDLIEKNLGVSNMEDDDLLDEVIGVFIIEEYRKLDLEKVNEDGYTIILIGYIQSAFQDFESYLRTKRVSEDDIELILKQNKPKFITDEITTVIYSNKDISDALKSFRCQIKCDDISIKSN